MYIYYLTQENKLSEPCKLKCHLQQIILLFYSIYNAETHMQHLTAEYALQCECVCGVSVSMYVCVYGLYVCVSQTSTPGSEPSP